jgi:hypothetical protein
MREERNAAPLEKPRFSERANVGIALDEDPVSPPFPS